MNVLSLFDGISCGKLALERAGVKNFKYYASEIDKNAIKCSEANHPNEIIRLGDVIKVSYKDGVLFYGDGEQLSVGKIDLLIGGSPCTSFSALGDRNGLDGKSKLFLEYLRILKEIQPENPDVIFLLENVRMKKEYKDNLDNYLNTVGVPICSSLLSIQIRKRFYWSNKTFSIPADLKLNFQDVKDTSNTLDARMLKLQNKTHNKMWSNGKGNNTIAGGCPNVSDKSKVYCLTTKQDRNPNSGLIEYKDGCRFLSQRELEIAQTVPIGYTSCLSYNQACAVLGNGWTVEVISHILKDILKQNTPKRL